MGDVDTLARHALRATGPRDRLVEALLVRLPRVGLDGVLGDLDRGAEACDVPGDAAGRGFMWDPADRDDPDWTPQGLACTRSGDVLLAAWYGRRRWLVRTQGSRVSVVDLRDAERPRYRHVLLVAPRRRLGSPGVRPVPVHAGGIAVLGDLLYVADTIRGVRVFRLSDVARVPAPPRRRTGGYTTHGYRYVLPELLQLRLRLRSGPAHLRCSFLSVGTVEGRLSLVIGEYGRKGTTPRLVRYPLDPVTGLPVTDPDGRCAPLEVHENQPHRMQGVAVEGSTWVVSASSGRGNPGDLHVGRPGAFRRHRGVLPPGPEDLDWSRPGERLWGLTEWPGQRWVFPVDVGRWTGT